MAKDLLKTNEALQYFQKKHPELRIELQTMKNHINLKNLNVTKRTKVGKINRQFFSEADLEAFAKHMAAIPHIQRKSVGFYTKPGQGLTAAKRIIPNQISVVYPAEKLNLLLQVVSEAELRDKLREQLDKMYDQIQSKLSELKKSLR